MPMTTRLPELGGLSIQEAKFLELLTQEMSSKTVGNVCVARIYQEVYGCKQNSAQSSAYRMMKRLIKSGAIATVLERVGVTLPGVLSGVKEMMTATDLHRITHPDGNWTVWETVNWPAREKGLKLAGLFFGMNTNQQKTESDPEEDMGRLSFTDFVLARHQRIKQEKLAQNAESLREEIHGDNGRDPKVGDNGNLWKGETKRE